MVGAPAADDLQTPAAAWRRVEFDVSGGFQLSFGPAGNGAPFRPVALVASLTAAQFVAAAAAAQDVVARSPVDRVRLAVADEDVVEGGALEALEAEEPVVAVAAGLVLRKGSLDAAIAPGPDVGGE